MLRVADHTKLQNDFKAAMLKLSLLGANQAEMVDCSDVIPNPPPLPANAGPHLPPDTTMNDIEIAVCNDTPMNGILLTNWISVCIYAIPSVDRSSWPRH